MMLQNWLFLRFKCIKFNFGWGFASDNTREAYSAPQTVYSCDKKRVREIKRWVGENEGGGGKEGRKWGGVIQWLGRRSSAGGLSLIDA